MQNIKIAEVGRNANFIIPAKTSMLQLFMNNDNIRVS